MAAGRHIWLPIRPSKRSNREPQFEAYPLTPYSAKQFRVMARCARASWMPLYTVPS